MSKPLDSIAEALVAQGRSRLQAALKEGKEPMVVSVRVADIPKALQEALTLARVEPCFRCGEIVAIHQATARSYQDLPTFPRCICQVCVGPFQEELARGQ